LLNHPEVREKMGEDGYNFAKDFTLERFQKEWAELINKLI
jgi:glycosyltransferase involved in cell wall biosynthesis